VLSWHKFDRGRGAGGFRQTAGETFIRVNGVRSLPARVGFILVLIVLGALSAGCGGGGEETTVPPPTTTPSATSPAAGEGTVGIGQAETARDVPFSLNTEQPIPPDLREAYQRRALISIQFFKVGEDPFYPQGLEPDRRVQSTMKRLSSSATTSTTPARHRALRNWSQASTARSPRSLGWATPPLSRCSRPAATST
jgi:hypothetical protein